jgi:hypothetical protein
MNSPDTNGFIGFKHPIRMKSQASSTPYECNHRLQALFLSLKTLPLEPMSCVEAGECWYYTMSSLKARESTSEIVFGA